MIFFPAKLLRGPLANISWNRRLNAVTSAQRIYIPEGEPDFRIHHSQQNIPAKEPSPTMNSFMAMLNVRLPELLA